MFFTITYDYSQKIGEHYRTFTGNMVGRYGRTPIGYGPVGPGSQFTLEELPEVVRVLTKQLGTIPSLHLHPYPDEDSWPG